MIVMVNGERREVPAEATGVVINGAEFGSSTYLVLLALGVLGTAAAVGLLVDLAVRPGILAAVAWIVLATGIAVVTGNLDLLAGQLVLGVVLVAAVFKDNANRTRHRAAGRAA